MGKIDSSETDRAHFQVYFVSDGLIIQPPTDMYLNLERFSTKRNNFPFSIPSINIQLLQKASKNTQLY
jgi:hypothetical protein